MSGITIVTDEVVEQQAREVMKLAQDLARKGEPIPSSTLVACRVDPLTGEPMDFSRCLVPVMGRNCGCANCKRRLTWMARSVGIVGDALATITLFTTQAIERRAVDGPPPDGAFDSDPATREAIVVLTEWRHRRDVHADIVYVTRDQGIVDFDVCEASELGNPDAIDFESLLVFDERLADVPADIVAAARPIAITACHEAGRAHRAALARMVGGEVPRG